MFFSGDPSTRKRVDLGGRSSKERDRQKLLEQTRLERNKRMRFRQETSAATKIQKCFRGRRVVEGERSKVREQFFSKYGKSCQNIDMHCFGLDSDLLRQFLFFFNPRNAADFSALVELCRLLQQFVKDSGDILLLFGGTNHMTEDGLVVYRMKRFAYACIQAIYQKRNQLKDQLFMSSSESSSSTVLLLESLVMLIEPKVSWACAVVAFLLQRNVYFLIREIVLTGKESIIIQGAAAKISSLEHVLVAIMSHIGQKPCICATSELQQTFISQILTIPLLWQLFPYLKEIFTSKDLSQQYIHHTVISAKCPDKFLPTDVSAELPSHACLLGNLLEIAALAFAKPDCSPDLAMDFTHAATSLLEELTPFRISDTKHKEPDEDEMDIDEKITDKVLNAALKQQISNAIDPRFLLQLTNILFRGFSRASDSFTERPIDEEVAAVSAACSFLHVTFNILPLERIMTVLAYRAEIIPVLWNIMKRCHENKKWSSFSEQSAYLPGDAPGWLLPLAVFCPIYKHMLMIVDNEEFYEQEKPLSLKDIRCLIVILRQALWQLLWLNPPVSPSFAKSATSMTSLKSHPVEFIQYRVSVVASELLSQLQDWNNRRQFTPPSDFQADGVNEHFNSQAMIEGSRAYDVLKQAPFLVPFTSRVKIFTSQLAAAKESSGSRVIFTGNRFRIRRDHILEDAFSQLSKLSEEDLKAAIRVTFVNEFGVEEAGIDGGGIFKDFMENISRAAFDAQYGLFKETTDHLLYPNPGSAMVHEQHLQFFHFLGTLLAKAMFEGILVDIPFATFFLSKLKQKHNYLNDLPSLDPELYRHLIFLKRYKGDISELELYFVIVNNEYGEQTVEDLLPAGKNTRVTNENVITFIHLVANHRLNYQIRQQSSHFYRGFQQLIQKDWIDMFNEHELQLMISGSVDGIDLEDLRSHTNYAGGYHPEHYVIDMFWDVLKTFSMENQRKFLKFVTGCSRGPLLGFKYLEPLFCIQRAGADASEEALDRLPTSATCMNLLKLPPYRSKEQMEQKLLYSINADAGFDLS